MEIKEEARKYIVNGKLDIDSLLDDYYDYLYSVIKNYVTLPNEDIEEIIADVFIAVWKNNPRIGEIVSIKYYMVGIAKNIINKKYRTIKTNNSLYDYEELLEDSTNIEMLAIEKEQEKIIKLALKNIKSEEYKIFILFYCESNKIKDIAKKMNISESKVKVVLHRIRNIIKKSLKDGGYSYEK